MRKYFLALAITVLSFTLLMYEPATLVFLVFSMFYYIVCEMLEKGDI